MNRRSWLPLVAVMLALLVSTVAWADDIHQFTGSGKYQNIKSGDYTTSQGYQQVYQMNRTSDDNTIIPVVTGLTLSPASGYYLTNFVDLSLYNQFQLHVDWADSAKTQATVDSTLFEIIPVGKFSTTADGYDYAINLGGNAGAADTVFAGWVFGSPRNPTMQAGIAPAGCMFNPNYVYRPGPGGGTATNVKFLFAASLPLSTKYGGWIAENYMGFLIRAISRASNAATNIHSLNVYITAKAN